MADVEKLLSEYIAEHGAGGKADPLEYLNRVEGTDRAELEALIEGFLERSPGREWDAASYAGSSAERAAESVSRSLEGVSGWWPAVLPRMRSRARLTREEVVRRLAAALGAGEKEPKVAAYYHQMEQGTLPSDGVSQRVLAVLSEIYGSSAERLRDLGRNVAAGGMASPVAGAAAPAMMRKAIPDDRYVEADSDEASDESRREPVAPAQRDEIDEFFTGGF